ncbi:MAG: outer membrane beta-barrel protein [Gammaproteobacteria bacterium]
MKSNLIKSTLTAGIIIMTFGNANAEWYVGADAEKNDVLPSPSSLSDSDFSSYDILNYKNRENVKDTSFSLFGGYRTTQNFSLQLEYQDELAFGIDDMFSGSSLLFPESNTQNFESNGLFLSGISSYPINDNGVLYMKGGLFNWEADSSYYETRSDYLGQTRGTDIFYGLGANYDLSSRFGVSAEWERYQMEKSDVDYLSTKLKYKF